MNRDRWNNTFAILMTCAGNSLALMEEEIGIKVSIPALILYNLKSFFWIFLSSYERKNVDR